LERSKLVRQYPISGFKDDSRPSRFSGQLHDRSYEWQDIARLRDCRKRSTPGKLIRGQEMMQTDVLQETTLIKNTRLSEIAAGGTRH
jgi:hypothetical protein